MIVDPPIPDAGPTPDKDGGPGAATDAPPMPADTSSPRDVQIEAPAVVPEVAPVPPLPMCPAAKMGEIDLWVPGQGNCSYPLSALPEHVAAVDRELYAAAATCGACLEVTSDRGTVIANVVDQYPVPPSPRGHKISLSKAALTKVAGPGVGLAYLSWRWVPCPVGSGSIMAALKVGSNQFYWEIILSNFTNRIVKFEFATGPETWQESRRQSYNYFYQPSARGLPPRLRLTDTEGNVRTTDVLKWPTDPETTPIPLNVQFPAACKP